MKRFFPILLGLVLPLLSFGQTFQDVLTKGPAGPPVLPPHAAAQIMQGNWQIMHIEDPNAPIGQAPMYPPAEQLGQFQFQENGNLRFTTPQGHLSEHQWQWIEGGRMLQAYNREQPWGSGHIEIESYQNGHLILRLTDPEHQKHRIILQKTEPQAPVTAPAEEKSWW